MPADRLLFFLAAVPVLLVGAFFLLASPWYALASLRSKSARGRAGLLLLAWGVLSALLALYLLSGWWYRENTATRPVAPEEYLELLGFTIFGVLLPGVAWGRLRVTRRRQP